MFPEVTGEKQTSPIELQFPPNIPLVSGQAPAPSGAGVRSHQRSCIWSILYFELVIPFCPYFASSYKFCLIFSSPCAELGQPSEVPGQHCWTCKSKRRSRPQSAFLIASGFVGMCARQTAPLLCTLVTLLHSPVQLWKLLSAQTGLYFHNLAQAADSFCLIQESGRAGETDVGKQHI